ncbi:MAG: hypothetical protein ACOX1Y_06075 [Zhaonellaceae bacterium]
MEKNRAYYNYARQTAINIWLQLTEYAQDKILTYFEKLEDNEEIIKWYIYLDEGSKYHNRFPSQNWRMLLGISIASSCIYLKIKNYLTWYIMMLEREKNCLTVR